MSDDQVKWHQAALAAEEAAIPAPPPAAPGSEPTEEELAAVREKEAKAAAEKAMLENRAKRSKYGLFRERVATAVARFPLFLKGRGEFSVNTAFPLEKEPELMDERGILLALTDPRHSREPVGSVQISLDLHSPPTADSTEETSVE